MCASLDFREIAARPAHEQGTTLPLPCCRSIPWWPTDRAPATLSAPSILHRRLETADRQAGPAPQSRMAQEGQGEPAGEAPVEVLEEDGLRKVSMALRATPRAPAGRGPRPPARLPPPTHAATHVSLAPGDQWVHLARHRVWRAAQLRLHLLRGALECGLACATAAAAAGSRRQTLTGHMRAAHRPPSPLPPLLSTAACSTWTRCAWGTWLPSAASRRRARAGTAWGWTAARAPPFTLLWITAAWRRCASW